MVISHKVFQILLGKNKTHDSEMTFVSAPISDSKQIPRFNSLFISLQLWKA